MFSLFILFLLSPVKTQYFNPSQSHPYSQYNSWLTHTPGYPTIQQNRPSVRGNLLSNDGSELPYGSQIIVSLVDTSLQDVAARPLSTFTLYGSYRFPIAYDIPYSLAQVQSNGNTLRQYAVQARIERNGQLLYINDQYTPVRLIPIPLAPINVAMKRIDFGNNGGIFTTRPPIINNQFVCQLRPDQGFCYASIEQYYFNPQFRSCQTFIWGGCGGNQNRFDSRGECERACLQYRRRLPAENAKRKWIN